MPTRCPRGPGDAARATPVHEAIGRPVCHDLNDAYDRGPNVSEATKPDVPARRAGCLAVRTIVPVVPDVTVEGGDDPIDEEVS